MPFSNSIWGACCFESSSGHHESSSIEFWPCFQNYSIFNLSWTSFHLLSPLGCLLRQRTWMFPDLMQWGWFVLTYLLFWFATGLKYDRVAGTLHNASAGASVPQQASSVITSPHSPGCCTSRWWAASLRAAWDVPKEMDLPSAGLNQTPSGSTCTHKNNTHKWHMWAIASSSFSCKIALYSAAYVFKQVIFVEKNKSKCSSKDEESLQQRPLLEITWTAEYWLKHLWSFSLLPLYPTDADSILCRLPACRVGTKEPAWPPRFPSPWCSTWGLQLWGWFINCITRPLLCPHSSLDSAKPLRTLKSMAIKYMLKGFKACSTHTRLSLLLSCNYPHKSQPRRH